MDHFSRREFVSRSALLGAAAASLGSTAPLARAVDKPAAKGAANERLRVAVVGVRSRGMTHVNGYLGKNNCEIVAICDADEAVITNAMNSVTAHNKKAGFEAPKFVQDFRTLLEDKSIDCVSIATPNHWHALMAVWAMRAGKHVYVEKPATHNVHEGRLLAQAARKYKRICQVGTQSRSNPGMRAAIQHIHDGNIGKVTLAYGACFRSRKSIGKVDAPTEPPKTLNYDLWCGPATKVPVKRKNLHYDWHWIWAYGNGDFGNQGVHEADKARWGLQVGLPTSVVSFGGRFGFNDDGETPNTELSLFEYPNAHIVFEVRNLDTKDFKGVRVGNIWFGDKGYVVCPNYASGVAYNNDGKEVKKFTGGGDQNHFDNFIKAVRSGNPADLNCEAEEGHYSAALCHLGNISYRLGRPAVVADDIRIFEKVVLASETLERQKTHLKDNKIDIATVKGLVGVKLTLDPKTEKFTAVGDGADLAKANDMLFREYRKGFDISEAV